MGKKKDEPITEPAKEILDYDSPATSEEIRALADAIGGTSGVTALEEKTKFTVALELFKVSRLPLITDLDKEKVEALTRHDTWIESASLVFGLKKDDPLFTLITDMGNSYQLHQVSRGRKSRKEIVDILQDRASEYLRSAGDKLIGKR